MHSFSVKLSLNVRKLRIEFFLCYFQPVQHQLSIITDHEKYFILLK